MKSKSKPRSKIVTEQSRLAPNTGISPDKLSLIMALLCAIFGFVLYINTLGHDYAIDDDTVIQKNTIVTKGVSAIPEIFTSGYRKGFWDRDEAMYRPLSLAMFAVEYQLAPEKPWLNHFVNILLYSLTGFILFYTLRIILSTYNILIPLFATLLFIAHPIHTEVVANIKSRDELLAFLFIILSLYFLFMYQKNEKKNNGLLFLSTTSFLLALLSKESAITVLAVYPFALYFFSTNKSKEIFKLSLLFILPLIAYFLLRFHAIGTISNLPDILPINNSLITANSFTERIATAIFILGKYLGLLIFPHPLSFDYSLKQIPNVSFNNVQVIFTITVFISLIYYSIKNFKNKNLIGFCVFFFLITISLVSNLIILIESTMAERFLYTSSLAFSLALSYLLVTKMENVLKTKNNLNINFILKKNKTVSLTMILILTLYSIKTIGRNSCWKDNLTLLQQDIKTCPNSCRILFSYGGTLLFTKALKEKNELKKDQLLNDAISKLEKGNSILQTFPDSYLHLGLAYTEKKNYSKAVANFEAAKSIKKWVEPDFFVSSGLAYHLAGQCEKAVADFKKAIELDPKKEEAYGNWGLCLIESNKLEESIEKLNFATQLSPNYATAWYNLGNAYARLNLFNEAIKYYKTAVSIDPNYIDALINIGNCYGASQNSREAITYYEKVLSLDPFNKNALTNITTSYKLLGEEKKAEEYSKLIRNDLMK